MPIRPLKQLGQNFLSNAGIVAKIIQEANLQKDDVVLEVGPGKGILTKEIAKQVKKVIAIEKDIRLIEPLKEELKDCENVIVVHGDILNFQFSISNFQSISNDPIFKEYKVVANLPFYLANHLIRKFLELEVQPKQMTLIIQKEVAKRIVAKPPKTNLLAISVDFYADAKILFYIPKKYFKPVPKVDSAIIQITPRKKYQANPKNFFQLVKAGYSHPRKQLQNNLKNAGEFRRARAENLSTDNWIDLLKMV